MKKAVVCPTCGRHYKPRLWQVSEDAVTMDSPKKVADEYLMGIARAEKEHFVVLHLDTKHRVKFQETVSIGTLNASLVHPREVFRKAIQEGTYALILAHNHPSGDTFPSQDDLKISHRLEKVGKLVGIEILDHIIASGDSFYSIREHGLMNSWNKIDG